MAQSNFKEKEIKTIQLKNVEMGYQLSGCNHDETILFVHGLGPDLSQFENQYNYFNSKYNVLLVNVRGHGNTRLVNEPIATEFELNKMADDIIELLDSLRIANVHYVGNSMGGNIGYEIMNSHPEVLKSFTTFGTTGQLTTSKFTQRMMRLTYKVFSAKTLGNLSKSVGQTSESKKKIKEMMSKTNKTTVLGVIPNIAKLDYLYVIKHSKMSALIIKGDKDKAINKVIDNTVLAFENRGGFQLSKIEKAGHFTNLDNPALFNTILEKFLLENKE